MKEITVKELQEGDEIIIPSNSNFKYLKVLKNPSLSNKKGWGKYINSDGYFTWDKNVAKYKSILCSTRIDEITRKYKNHIQDTPDKSVTFKEYIFETDCEKHNKRVSVDLNYKKILLIKRKEQ